MRKVMSICLMAGVLAVAAASLASGASTLTCGTRYTPACTSPTTTVAPLSLVCHDAGASFRLPTITATSNSGIKSIVIKLGSKVLKSIKYKAGTSKTSVKGLTVHTGGLGTGVHTITVTTTDVRGKKVTRTLRFSICKPVPLFTG